MDDILQFLMIAGAIAFGVFRQFKKTEANKSEKRIPMPTSDYESEPVPIPENPIVSDFSKKKATSAYQPVVPTQAEGVRTTAYTPIPPSALIDETDKIENEFAIHSLEEAKRAIVWSEILQRKY